MNYLSRGENLHGAKITMCIVFNLNVIRQNTYQDLYSLAKNTFSYFSPPLIIKIVNICSDKRGTSISFLLLRGPFISISAFVIVHKSNPRPAIISAFIMRRHGAIILAYWLKNCVSLVILRGISWIGNSQLSVKILRNSL